MGDFMILEAAMLHVKQGMEKEYEEAFRMSSEIISSMTGYNITRIKTLYGSRGEISTIGKVGNIRRPYSWF